MSLLRYEVDLRSLSDTEKEKYRQLLERVSETGLSITPIPGVFQFYLDERESPAAYIKNDRIPLHLVPYRS